MERIILHIDMDCFFAQIEERENPQFKGRPLVVGSDPKGGSGRGVVSTANYIARKYGIHSALPISQAFRLCPEAVFLPVNFGLYERVSENIFGILRKYSERVETVSLDEAYLDLSYLNGFKEGEKVAREIKNEILEKEKLTSTIGLGSNKAIAKIAVNQAKPNGLKVVLPEEAEAFLNHLEVEEIPGIGPKKVEELEKRGIRKVSELKELGREKLRELFGKAGETIYGRIRGKDEEEVSLKNIIKSLGREHTFEKDTRDPEIIFKVFDGIVEYIWEELGKKNLSFKTLTVVCRYQGFETHTRSLTLKEKERNFRIFKRESKKMLLKFLISSPKLIRLIGLRVICLEK
ncbi:MAG: DNA polymerase IV [Candidatus Pacebacteria bacterium]|nr:DNA polymerase IV [Candidatus Paceibacterota bacterium]